MADENTTQNGVADPTATPPAPQVTGTGTESTDVKTFTETEFNTQLENAKKEWETEFKAKLEADNDEAKKLAKMSADEKLAYKQKQFENEKTQYKRDKMEFETGKMLADKSLPVGLAKYLCGESAETTKANISEFEKAFSQAVESAVTDRLRSKPPKSGSDAGVFTMENLKNMSADEINAHWDEIKKIK